MATKPTETLNFEPSGTAVVAVPSGKQTAGFLPGEKPPAQYLNWLFRTFSRLYNYVKDGQFTGNHTITGNLSVTGSVALGDATADEHTVNGTVSFADPVTLGAASSVGRLILKTSSVSVVAADNNDLNVGDGVLILPISPGAGTVLNGFAGGVDGRLLIVFRASASGATQITHESTGSVAANRIALATNTSATLNNARDCVVLCYHTSRWREICRNFT